MKIPSEDGEPLGSYAAHRYDARGPVISIRKSICISKPEAFKEREPANESMALNGVT